MSSRHLVDPALTLLADHPGFPFEQVEIAKLRAMMAEMAPARAAPPDDVAVSEATAAGRGGGPDVRLVITQPKQPGTGRPGILHVHGGGYVMGAPEMTGETDARYAQELDAVCVSVDYRLAPETPFPGPLEDCYAGLAWLFAHADELGVDKTRIVVSGESAGGGLAAALVLMARDHGEYPIAYQHLVFPMLDDRTVTHEDPSPFFGQFLWTPAANRFGWTSLLGQAPGGTDIPYLAAPARASDLSRLPPTFMACGALDLFLEEDIDYARRMMRAGVPVEMHIYPGAPHGFMLVPDADVSRQFGRDSLAALARAVTPPT